MINSTLPTERAGLIRVSEKVLQALAGIIQIMIMKSSEYHISRCFRHTLPGSRKKSDVVHCPFDSLFERETEATFSNDTAFWTTLANPAVHE